MATDLTQPDHSPAVYEDDQGNIIYRASAVGGCTKMLAALRQEYSPKSPPQWLIEKMEESTLLEDDAIDQFVADHSAIIDRIERQTEPVSIKITVTEEKKTVFIRGKPDTKAYLKDGRKIIVEVKNLSPVLWESYTQSLPIIYKAQGTIYSLNSDGIVYVLRNKGKKDGTEEENRGKGKIEYIWYDETPMDLSVIIEKVKQSEKWYEEMDLPDKCDPLQFPCPVYYLHEQDDIEPWEDVSAQREFDELCRVYNDARRREKEAKSQKSQARRKLLGVISDHPELFADNRISSPLGTFRTYRSGNTVIDEDRLRKFLAEHGEKMTSFLTRNEYDVWMVDWRGE